MVLPHANPPTTGNGSELGAWSLAAACSGSRGGPRGGGGYDKLKRRGKGGFSRWLARSLSRCFDFVVFLSVLRLYFFFVVFHVFCDCWVVVVEVLVLQLMSLSSFLFLCMPTHSCIVFTCHSLFTFVHVHDVVYLVPCAWLCLFLA